MSGWQWRAVDVRLTSRVCCGGAASFPFAEALEPSRCGLERRQHRLLDRRLEPVLALAGSLQLAVAACGRDMALDLRSLHDEINSAGRSELVLWICLERGAAQIVGVLKHHHRRARRSFVEVE